MPYEKEIMMENKIKARDPGKLGIGKLLLWCSNGVSTSVEYVVLSFLTLYCTNALGLNAALVGTLLMASKIFDGVTDLFAGYIVDRTNTRWGRGRPYDLCILGVWLTTWLLFSVPVQYSTAVKCVWIFVCYALCQSVFRTMLSAGGTPYMVRAFNNDQAYIKINSIGGLLTTLVIVVFNVVFPIFYAQIISDAPGWSRLIGFIAIPMAVIGILRFFFIPEKYAVDDKNHQTTLKDLVTVLKENKYIYPVAILLLVTGIGSNMTVTSYYFLYIVKNVQISGVMSLVGIVAMATMALYPILLKKISIKQLIQRGLYLTLSAGILCFFAKDNIPLLMIAGIVTGIGSLPCSYMSGLMIIECADYNEWQGRPRMEGTLGCVTNFASKIGAALGTFLVGLLLSSAGFDGTQTVQPATALLSIRFCYALLPAIFYVIAGLLLHFYKLDKMKPQIAADLAQKREARAAAAAVAAD